MFGKGVPLAQAPAPVVTKVMRLGDSNTIAIHSVNGSADRYYIEDRLTAAGGRFVGSQVNFTGLVPSTNIPCEGYSGAVCYWLYSPRPMPYWADQAVLRYDPDVIVMEVGVNDLGVNGHTAAQTAASHLQLLNHLFAEGKPGMAILVIAIPPVNDSYAGTTNAVITSTNVLIAANVAALAAAGKRIVYCDATAAIQAIPSWQTAAIYSDYLHLLDPAFSAMAETYWPYLLPLLGPVASMPTNLALYKSYTTSPAPVTFLDTFGCELTDGKILQETYSAYLTEATVGWHNANPVITVDLGSAQTVNRARAYFGGLDTTDDIVGPSGVVLSTSLNGTDFTVQSTLTGIADDMAWISHNFAPVSARYVRWAITRGAGADAWTMCGQVQVFGA